MKYLLAFSLVLLSGCSTLPAVPDTVEIPIAVPCKVTEPVQPQYRYQPPYQTTFEGVRDLLGDRQLALAYENELRIALKSCK